MNGAPGCAESAVEFRLFRYMARIGDIAFRRYRHSDGTYSRLPIFDGESWSRHGICHTDLCANRNETDKRSGPCHVKNWPK
jgi:hypothetical protein